MDICDLAAHSISPNRMEVPFVPVPFRAPATGARREHQHPRTEEREAHPARTDPTTTEHDQQSGEARHPHRDEAEFREFVQLQFMADLLDRTERRPQNDDRAAHAREQRRRTGSMRGFVVVEREISDRPYDRDHGEQQRQKCGCFAFISSRFPLSPRRPREPSEPRGRECNPRCARAR